MKKSVAQQIFPYQESLRGAHMEDDPSQKTAAEPMPKPDAEFWKQNAAQIWLTPIAEFKLICERNARYHASGAEPPTVLTPNAMYKRKWRAEKAKKAKMAAAAFAKLAQPVGVRGVALAKSSLRNRSSGSGESRQDRRKRSPKPAPSPTISQSRLDKDQCPYCPSKYRLLFAMKQHVLKKHPCISR